MLSWGYSSRRNTSNSEYGRFDFGSKNMRPPTNGPELRHGNNTSFIHQSPNGSNNYTSNSYFQQPGCQHWGPSQRQGQGDDLTTPRFSVQVGDVAAAAAMGKYDNLPESYQNQYNNMPDARFTSEMNPTNAIGTEQYQAEAATKQGGQGDTANAACDAAFANSSNKYQTKRSFETVKKPFSSQQLKKVQLQQPNGPGDATSSMSITVPQQYQKANKQSSRYKLCGKCPKCKNIEMASDVPLMAIFPSHKIGRNQKLLNRSFLQLEGKNFKAGSAGGRF